jgi:activator of HSP90 ATPase
MTTNLFSRREFFLRITSVFSLFTARTAVGAVPTLSAVRLVEDYGISQTAAAIHQEVGFKASRKRIYDALTDTKQFDRVIQLSKAGMSYGKKPTDISKAAGGGFSLFGGYIIGRHIELTPNERVVQAWREISWTSGIYSLVKFELVEQGADTKVIFDHTGFPAGAEDHLAVGWHENYWDPLKKYLAQAR